MRFFTQFPNSPQENTPQSHGSVGLLALSALGVIYGDIGTSPLYTIKECFSSVHGVPPTPENILGVLSLILWSLLLVVGMKYVVFIMRAGNKGEGGIFSLFSLLQGQLKQQARWWATLTILAASGAALLYGDGVITPAISVLSAIEGLTMVTDAATRFVVPLTCCVIITLFFLQRHGTTTIGKVFGPIMVVWFLALGFLGLQSILANPAILRAMNPWYAIAFCSVNHLHGIVVLGSVVLCITGGEALFADMGHFGRTPFSCPGTALFCRACSLIIMARGLC
jgi:KUP system potassium uptake protein